MIEFSLADAEIINDEGVAGENDDFSSVTFLTASGTASYGSSSNTQQTESPTRMLAPESERSPISKPLILAKLDVCGLRLAAA